jgi:regulator of sigma E protease
MRRKLFAALIAPVSLYLIAAVIMTITYVAFGVPVEGKQPMIGAVKDGMPAARAGLQMGDEIVSIGGRTIDDTVQVVPAINAAGDHVSIEVVRDGQRRDFTVEPMRDGDVRRIGIEIWPVEKYERASFFTGLGEGLAFPPRYGAFILHGFKEIFAGRQKAEFSGPIGIVRVMHKQPHSGVNNLLQMIAILAAYVMMLSLLAAPLIFWRASRS